MRNIASARAIAPARNSVTRSEPGKLRKGEAAEIDAAKRGHVAGQVRFGGRLFHAAARDAPAPRVPGAERVRHVDHDRIVGRERSRQGRTNIDQACPQRIAQHEIELARRREREQQRVINREVDRLEACREVDLEEEAPDRAGCPRRISHRLDHEDVARKVAAARTIWFTR